MTPVIATTDEVTAAAAADQLEKGGNAVDAAVSALLAWPLSLASAGVLVAVGSGLGHGACLFPARVPGFGLSRPRRLRLLSGSAPAARIAATCAAPALAAILARWGTITMAEAANAAAAAGEAPHQAALTLLAEDGVNAFTRGSHGEDVARTLGPLAGGLLTRRDLIEARPDVGEAVGPFEGLWLSQPIVDLRHSAASATAKSAGRALSVVVIDKQGRIASASAEAGVLAERESSTLPPVDGVVPNTLLAGQPPARAKKVGQPLPLTCGAAASGELEQVALAGFAPELVRALEARDVADTEREAGGVLLTVRRSPGGQVEVEGAETVLTP